MDGSSDDTLRRWCREADQQLAAVLRQASDPPVVAYPGWSTFDLALHVARVYRKAATELGVDLGPDSFGQDAGRDEIIEMIAASIPTVGEAARTAERAVRMMVGADGDRRRFWHRRLLREATLHRWDLEDAGGGGFEPAPEVALELIDEFLATDVRRTLGRPGGRRTGRLSLMAGGRRWTVALDEARIVVGGGATRDGPTIVADPSALWLWLMRREGATPEVVGSGELGLVTWFAGLIDTFPRPTR